MDETAHLFDPIVSTLFLSGHKYRVLGQSLSTSFQVQEFPRPDSGEPETRRSTGTETRFDDARGGFR